MSETRGWSAPGKLFVSGEYAVLWGGTARLLALAPRTEALARRRDDAQVVVLLPGRRLEGTATPEGARWAEPPDQAFHFVARTIDLALRATPGPRPGFSVAFAPSPTHQGRKLGLGSSARAAVLAAEAARWALDAAFDPLRLALVAHAEAQGGRGSGGDVAAIFAGGSVAYRRFDPAPALAAATAGGLEAALARGPAVDLARLPRPALTPVYLFTGQSASTPALIGRAEQALSSARRAAFVEQSDALSAALGEALVHGDLASAREACRELQALLDGLGTPPEPALQRVLALASASGCAAKQSGAGGGDGCLAFAADQDAAAALVASATARGFHAFPVEVSGGLAPSPESESTLGAWLP